MKRILYPFIAALLFAGPAIADTFSDLDTNKDGILSRAEFERYTSDVTSGRIGSSVRDEVEPRARFGDDGRDIGSSESWHEESRSGMPVAPELDDDAMGAEVPADSGSPVSDLDKL